MARRWAVPDSGRAYLAPIPEGRSRSVASPSATWRTCTVTRCRYRARLTVRHGTGLFGSFVPRSQGTPYDVTDCRDGVAHWGRDVEH